MQEWPYIQAKNWTWANRQEIRLVVIHSMEAPEKPTTAESVARWFAGQVGQAPRASAHVCVDNNSLIRCVLPQHIAWAAPGANRDGYQIEHAGYARQSADEWLDEYSLAMLRISAEHAGAIAERYAIPVRQLTWEEVRAGERGFCSHHAVTLAYRKSTHTDPGPHFPWKTYMELVEESYFGAPTPRIT